MNRIASERKLRGLTQDDLSCVIGVSRETVARWENGTANPSTSAILAMADAFECSTDYLLGRTMERTVR